MKELELEEVLRITGGVPHAAALDEITYRAPQDADRDPRERERLLGNEGRPSEPV